MLDRFTASHSASRFRAPRSRSRRLRRLIAGVALAQLPWMLGCGGSNPAAPKSGLARVHGVVRFTNTHPGRDCFVTLFRRLIPPPPPGDSLHSDYAISDSLGNYQFDGVPPGTYGLYTSYFSVATYADSLFAGDSVIVTPGGEIAARPLVLREGGVFAGQVRDSATRAPIGAIMLVDGFLVLGLTDSVGHYALPGIPPGTWHVLGVVPDSLAPKRGQVAGTLPAPGDSVALSDLFVAPFATHSPERARTAFLRARIAHAAAQRAAVRWRAGARRSPPR